MLAVWIGLSFSSVRVLYPSLVVAGCLRMLLWAAVGRRAEKETSKLINSIKDLFTLLHELLTILKINIEIIIVPIIKIYVLIILLLIET